MVDILPSLSQARAYHRAGQLHLAEPIYRQILQADPAHDEANFLLGALCQALGKLDQAAVCLRQAVRLAPHEAQVHNYLGVVLAQQGKMDEAAACFQQAVRLKPDFTDAQNNLHKARTSGGPSAAATSIPQFQQVVPASAETHNDQAVLLANEGKLTEAAASFQRAIQLAPDFAKAYFGLGTVLRHLGRVDQAISCLQQAVQIKPDYAEAHLNLGNTFLEKGLRDEALASYREALRLKPDFIEAQNNVGAALAAQWKLDEAIACWQRTLQLQPDDPAAHNNLGFALFQQGKFAEALGCYERALQLKPDFGDAHNNRSLLWLLLGNFEQGWPEFEWRWQTAKSPPRRFSQPVWDGAPLEGKTILLHAEQGLGDTIQFIRYAPLVKRRGATVLVECQKPLLKLLARCPGIDQLVGQRDALPPFDVHAPLLNLPGVFQTNLSTIPATVPYLFADPHLVEHWRGKLQSIRDFKIGIAWQGNATLGQDYYRSPPLSCFAPLAEVPGTCLVSLQKGAGVDQLAEIRERFPVIDFTSELDETSGPFMDTAATMMNLDLIVTSDTSVAHLAGALGVPVWIALALVPDWRWLLDRDDSPWYPTMRLFRQKKLGDWTGVFVEIQQALIATRPPQYR